MATGKPRVDEESLTRSDHPNDHDLPAAAWAPQRRVTAPPSGLPHLVTADADLLYVVGAHGGSGESTLAGLLEKASATEHRWPKTLSGETRHAVLVARTSASGLLAAQAALRQWVSGAAIGAALHGLVLFADQPGRLPRELSDLAKMVAGGAPNAWRIPWIEAWRRGAPPSLNDSRRLTRAVDDLNVVIDRHSREVSYAPTRVHVADHGPS